MNTVFIGGSRRVSRLPAAARDRVNNVIEKGLAVSVGDANGADKAVQEHLAGARYDRVTVYCSGDSCRNNVGRWKTRHVKAKGRKKDFQFYAAKDREMAETAEFGLMIWDGKSPGTILNILRLVRASKKAVLISVPDQQEVTFRTRDDWDKFLSACDERLWRSLEKRALSSEWFDATPAQASLGLSLQVDSTGKSTVETDLARGMENALAAGDPKEFVDYLGRIAREQGMSQVAKDTGLAREALYRALSADGNPAFGTVLKVTGALGLELLVAKKSATSDHGELP